MGNCNFERKCKNEIQYVCHCLDSETFCCEIHLKEHLKALDRNHNFDSIPSGLSEWTKDGFLKFLESEKLEKEKLRTIVSEFFAQNSNIPTTIIEKYLNELDYNWIDINGQIENISQASKQDEDLLVNPWILQPNSDAERAENMLLNSLNSNLKLFCRLGELRNKRLAILNKIKNDSETEQDFRRICALYQNNTSNFLLSQAHKKYVKEYQKLSSLYLISRSQDKIKLFIYDTENQREEIKILKAPKTYRDSNIEPFGFSDKNSIIQLPNNELFVYGSDEEGYKDKYNYDYIACIINIFDTSYRIRYLPQSRNPKFFYTAIYFNKNIYCFGYGYHFSDDFYFYRNGKHNGRRYQLSTRFDLDKNRWIELTPMEICHKPLNGSIIFKGNILFSEYDCYLFLYSIEINSYSTIPYKFAKNTAKILINIEERLYLIECGKNRWIYESEAGDEYNWQKISPSKIHDKPHQFYISYNKGQIYISVRFHQYFREYFKFDLNQKKFIEIACYGDTLSLDSFDDKLEAIECAGQTFKLDPSYNKLKNHLFYTALRLDKIEWLNWKFKKHKGKNWHVLGIKKGNTLCELGRNCEAIDSYNEAIKESLYYLEPFYKKGKALRKLGRNLEALESYSKFLSNGDDYKGYFKKGQVLCDLGRNIEALEYFDKAIFRHRTDKYVYVWKGYALRGLGKNNEAIKCYNEAIKQKPANERDYCAKGDALYELDRKSEALECYNEAINIENNYTRAYRKKGLILHDFGKYIDAIECYNEVIKLEPTNKKAYCSKGDAFYCLGRNFEALGCYNEVIELDQNCAMAYRKKGKVFHNLGRNLEAMECFNESIKLDPNDSQVFCYRATLFNEIRQEEEALKDFNTVYNLMVKDPTILVTSYECLGLLKKLLDLLESAIKAKEEFQKIKDKGLKILAILNETEVKESIITEQRSQFIKRVVECLNEYKKMPIEEIKQMKIEVAEHQKAMIDAVADLRKLLSLKDKMATNRFSYFVFFD